MTDEAPWSVWWGTSWWIVHATSDAQARQRAFARLQRLTRYHFPWRRTSAERDADRAELLARLTVRPATGQEIETYRLLCVATMAEGGAAGRLAALQGTTGTPTSSVTALDLGV